MKLTKLLSILVIAVIAFSCSKNDDNTDTYNYNKDNLTGTYAVTAFKSKEVKTVKVDGFDVFTTTVITGDTFRMNAIFDSTDILTMDGIYRIVKVKTYGDQTIEEADYIVLDNEEKSYSVNAATSELTFGGKTYKVSDFGRTGFKISFEKTTVESNGDSTVYTEEWSFKK